MTLNDVVCMGSANHEGGIVVGNELSPQAMIRLMVFRLRHGGIDCWVGFEFVGWLITVRAYVDDLSLIGDGCRMGDGNRQPCWYADGLCW